MTATDDTHAMQALADALGTALPAAVVEPLATYVAQVRRWNARVNLVSARAQEGLVELLLADALVLADRTLTPARARLVDVGAGAGAPTLPLLLLRPDLHALCVEPRRKRATFVRATGARLGLADRAEVLEARVDPERPSLPGAPFDLALARATFAPAEWLAIGARLAARVVVMTAREAPPPPEGLRVVAVRDYLLPTTGAPRRITVYEDVTLARG